MGSVPAARHLVYAKDQADARYFEPLSVDDLARAAGLQSVGSFTTSFTRTYGRSPAGYRAAFPPASNNIRLMQVRG
ncbi:MAG TPA: AraC family transcriptional regulator [Streptosporangiaceae bacterium]|nr:AraC family transcriptional regulator [Streptosporangiaceae bacterium]